MTHDDHQSVSTLGELWEAAYCAGYADALLERAPQPHESLPDGLPIDQLPYPVDV